MGQKDTLVNKLIANQENVSNDAIKKALEKHQEQQSEAQTNRILKELDTIQTVLDRKVTMLRSARETEKRLKKELVKINDAYEQYKIDADFDKFKKVARDCGIGIF